MQRHTDSIHQLHLHAAYWLSISTGALIITVLIGVALLAPGSYPDPFAPYEAIMPGQPAGSLDAFGCYANYLQSSPHSLVCPIKNTDAAVFSNIHTFANEGVVWQITFYAENLQVVDLIRHFGKPQTIKIKERSYILSWENRIYAHVPIAARRYHHQLRVLFVTVKLPPDFT